ncbi:nitrate- and nitrite sensing domain-containing protein [Streptosporangium sp. NBC_01755]|uniref:nitrate- and nitrite sensing domain-containing protein n=1 Tax=unclassified Streptosporangium TaxID=2632669 RepID=UPI002DDBE783|nr:MULTISPECIES: nitrate- and nitrite sensing domain-containing protein [unclassified Streptosporangium]WSA23815.1 nitrate- and nitrite sensing domain-containing protein [Streptosporangium sp. NBC_01810]WSC98113.1 nitrate- and nitrite sensing domain-containing protein [Streptosporangium sp. NBC_01755]
MRRRLVALILVPTIAAVLLGGVQVLASMSASNDYRRINDLARLSGHVGALTHELAKERDHTAWFIALGRPASGVKNVRAQMDLVDGAVTRVRESGALLGREVSGRTRDEVETAITRLDDLPPLRTQALGSTLLPDAAIAAYTPVIADLISLHDELGKGTADDVLFGQALTLDALARAKEAVSFQRALLTVVLVAGRFEQEQMEQFLGALSTERNERKAFAAEAGSRDRRLFDEAVNGRTADRAEFLRELVLLRVASGVSLKGLDPAEKDDAEEWFDAATVVVDQMRGVEERHARDIVVRSQQLGDAEQSRALMVAMAVVTLLALVLVITIWVARSLVSPLRRLRGEALEVAGERLPAYVQRVRESREGEVVADVPPIGVLSRDEIGEVARAFDEVLREAVRLAGDEAKLRNTVNAMFVNLSRRSQNLVERQLSLVERLERGERDDQRLADLFKLDHLATRMRRNSENLLVLAGQEVARRWRQPVELMDVVRAALSEVENYERVTNRVQSEVAVEGPAVSDVVHLLAELVENAVSFSQTNTRVTVSSSRIEGGGVMVSVTDQGIGMTPDELSQANWRLANPQAADASVARHMGLFVVGRLAVKHDIRVRLRHQESGLTAMILLPETLLVTPPDAPQQVGYPQLSGALPAGVSPFTGPSFPAGAEGLSRRAPVLAAPTAQVPAQASPAPGWDRRPDANAPSVWSPPVERSRSRGEFPEPDSGLFGSLPGPLDSFPGQVPADGTGPLPRMGASPPAQRDEFLPIFASVESAWFRIAASSGEPGAEPDGSAAAAPGDPVPGKLRDEPEAWSSPGDGGWQAAQAASAPAHGGTTAAGLPRRTPKANLVPGSVAPLARAQSHPEPGAAPAPVSAERLRDRISSFQQGVHRARNELSNGDR